VKYWKEKASLRRDQRTSFSEEADGVLEVRGVEAAVVVRSGRRMERVWRMQQRLRKTISYEWECGLAFLKGRFWDAGLREGGKLGLQRRVMRR
jgi:hypothetical protein